MDAYVVDGLTRRHGTVLANDRISLRVAAGEVFGLLGPNGAGKSTLVRQLVALIRPDAGRIALRGRALERRTVGRWVGYLPQGDGALADVPVALALTTTARLRGLGRSAARGTRDELIHELGLAAVADRPLGLLSGGQRRLAAFATVLAGERPVLVLDEPTTGLDPVARRSVWSALSRRRREQGATVVLVTHNVLEAETVLDRVAVLDRGRVIACDTPGALKAAVSSDVRLDLVWRHAPPMDEPVVARLAADAVVDGQRWSLRMPTEQARTALGQLTSGAAYAALDDFTLATPSLEDVYLALGGRARDLEHGG
ncbi:MAG TPA: ABC transporter ATP-binding protein [Mycobacteriales bacterium]|nr:ABC transporter ATP-binding protein [Mycobacteriales bacterium]